MWNIYDMSKTLSYWKLFKPERFRVHKQNLTTIFITDKTFCVYIYIYFLEFLASAHVKICIVHNIHKQKFCITKLYSFFSRSQECNRNIYEIFSNRNILSKKSCLNRKDARLWAIRNSMICMFFKFWNIFPIEQIYTFFALMFSYFFISFVFLLFVMFF